MASAPNESKSRRVVVVGSCNTDLIAYTPRFPLPGETLHGHSFETGFGGKGANQCVACAIRIAKGGDDGKIIPRVDMVAAVGNDFFGRETVENFKNHGVGVDHVTIMNGERTGCAPIWVNDEGENSIVIIGGANDKLSAEHIDAACSVLEDAHIVMTQLEISVDTTAHAMQLAHKKGRHSLTIFNPAPARKDLPEELLSECDIIVPNETEAEILTGIAVDCEDSADRAAAQLMAMGCKVVIITLGERGAFVATADGFRKMVAAPPAEKVVDTSGAGDCFLGSFAYCIAASGEEDVDKMCSQEVLLEACQYAVKCATMSVQGRGTQSSFDF
eukprot:g3157.t1